MRKNAFLAVILAAVFAVSIVAPAVAVERISPNKNHTGNVGTSTRIWQYGYFDKLVGDGVNATQYGFPMTIVNATDSLTLSNSYIGKTIVVAHSSRVIKVSLPSDMTDGGWFYILNNSSTHIDVTPYPGDKIVALTNASSDTIRNSTAGNVIKMITPDGESWYGIPYGTWTDVN